MRPLKTKEVEKIIESKGFKFVRQTGSHMTYKDNTGKTVTLVNTREQSPGVIRNIAKLIGLKF